MNAPLTMSPTRALLALRVLLLAALLGYASAASTHDHDTASPAGDGLCAICVYAGGILGAPSTLPTATTGVQWHEPPSVALPGHVPPTVRSIPSIRGPPPASR